MNSNRRFHLLRVKLLLYISLLLAGVMIVPAGSHSQIVDYIVVDFPSISPNGDGVQDSSSVVVALQTAALRLLVTLEDTLAATVIDTLLDIGNPAAQSYETVWNGTDSLGTLLPEGGYRLSFAVADGSTPEEYARTVVVDVTRPVVALDRIEPGVYTPDIEGTSDDVTIYFYLTDLSEVDSVEVTLIDPSGLETVLPHGPLSNGLHSVSWAGDETSMDGLYGLSLRAYDEAGNESADGGSINVDTKGPDHSFIDPPSGAVREVPLTQEGYCWDRNGVGDAMLVWNGGDPFPPHGVSWRGDTLFWSFDLRDSVLVGGEYVERSCTLEAVCSDLLGHESVESVHFSIDLTPPDPPLLNTPRSPVHVPEYDVSGSSPEGDSIVVYRTAGTDTASWSVRPVLGKFSVTVDLLLGPNGIWAVAADEAGNWSAHSGTITVVYDDAAGFYYPEAFRGPDDFEIVATGEALGVEIVIYTLTGEEVVTLTGTGPATRFEIEWSLLNDDGEEVRNGPYLVVITVEYPSGRTVDKNFIAVVR